MKAQSTFKGQYVELEGYLGTIDSDGKYIGLGAMENDYKYVFQEVTCKITSDEQRNTIMEMNKGDHMIIRGKITDVGEILGYVLSIESIELSCTNYRTRKLPALEAGSFIVISGFL